MKAPALHFSPDAKAAEPTIPSSEKLQSTHHGNQLAARPKTRKFTSMVIHNEDPQPTSFYQDFLGKISQKLQHHEPILQALSQYYALRGDTAKSLRIDRKILKLHPHDPIAHYNLACGLALRKKTKDACQALSKAIQLGYHD
jgi:tetratricopeptide (TPR) repeat protein